MEKGFTLAESLVAIIIVGILSAVLMTSLSNDRDNRIGNYKVRFDGRSYFVESYTKENRGRCVFLSDKELRFCGDWSVEKLDVEK